MYGFSNKSHVHLHVYLCSRNLFLGCPSPDFYGENCSLSCSTHCINSRCHIETGHCFGCKDGYQGPMCEQRMYLKFIQSFRKQTEMFETVKHLLSPYGHFGK